MYFWGQRVFELKMEAEICCKTENISTWEDYRPWTSSVITVWQCI